MYEYIGSLFRCVSKFFPSLKTAARRLLPLLCRRSKAGCCRVRNIAQDRHLRLCPFFNSRKVNLRLFLKIKNSYRGASSACLSSPSMTAQWLLQPSLQTVPKRHYNCLYSPCLFCVFEQQRFPHTHVCSRNSYIASSVSSVCSYNA